MFGYYRVASAVNKTVVGNPRKNAEEILTLINEAHKKEVSVMVFPELTLTGYTASDLLLNQTLIASQNDSLEYILKNIKNINTISIVGIAVFEADRLYNCAVVIQNGKVLGVVAPTPRPPRRGLSTLYSPVGWVKPTHFDTRSER